MEHQPAHLTGFETIVHAGFLVYLTSMLGPAVFPRCHAIGPATGQEPDCNKFKYISKVHIILSSK